jgi:hypothetical protein
MGMARPAGNILRGRRNLKAEIRAGDLIYFFTSDKASWRGLIGREGYALVRNGTAVRVLITAMN